MRILVIATCPFPAGRGSQLLIDRTTRGLIDLGHDVTLLAPSFGERGREDPFPVVRVGLRLGRARVDSHPDPRRALDDAALAIRALSGRFDVLLGHHADGGVIAGLAGRATGTPSVYLRHSDLGAELALYGPLSTLSGAAGRALDASARRATARTITLSAAARVGDRDRCDAIPPPLDPCERRVEPADGRTVYYEGNSDRYQNPEWLDVAERALGRWSPKARLIRADGPAQRPARADLALVPRTLGGGFPMKLLAYWGAGLPAVCVESGSPGVEDGLDGFVVPGSGSPAAFARRVVDALGDPARLRRVRESARRRALVRHDPARVASLLESSLERARVS